VRLRCVVADELSQLIYVLVTQATLEIVGNEFCPGKSPIFRHFDKPLFPVVSVSFSPRFSHVDQFIVVGMLIFFQYWLFYQRSSLFYSSEEKEYQRYIESLQGEWCFQLWVISKQSLC